MEIKIASAQYPITSFQSLDDWRNHTRNWIKKAVSMQAELLLFPEYGSMELTSLFNEEIQASLALQLESMQNVLSDFKNLFKEEAHHQKVLIVAPSFPVKINDQYVNRTFIFYPDGTEFFQDKQMMTRFENEHWGISAGEKELKTFSYKKISFGINICYDGEFPQFAFKQSLAGMKVLLHPSCTEGYFGMNRVHIGARARALENQIYVVVSQTVGDALWSIAVDKNTGMAAFYSPCDHLFPNDGILLKGDINSAGWIIQNLKIELIDEIRKTGQVFNFNDMKKI